jgi:hypothetical protein
MIEFLEIIPEWRKDRERYVPDFRLRLTQPVYGNNVFFVWTATDKTDIYLLAGIKVGVDDGAPQYFLLLTCR